MDWEADSRETRNLGDSSWSCKIPTVASGNVDGQLVQVVSEQELWPRCVFASLKNNPVAGICGILSSKEGTVQGIQTTFEVCLWADLLLGYRVADLGQQNILCRVPAALPAFHDH